MEVIALRLVVPVVCGAALDCVILKLEEIDKFADGIAVQKVGVKTCEAARRWPSLMKAWFQKP